MGRMASAGYVVLIIRMHRAARPRSGHGQPLQYSMRWTPHCKATSNLPHGAMQSVTATAACGRCPTQQGALIGEPPCGRKIYVTARVFPATILIKHNSNKTVQLGRFLELLPTQLLSIISPAQELF